jgi:hypothetical protein
MERRDAGFRFAMKGLVWALLLFQVLLFSGSEWGFAQGTAVRVAAAPNDAGAEPFYAQEMGFFK